MRDLSEKTRDQTLSISRRRFVQSAAVTAVFGATVASAWGGREHAGALAAGPIHHEHEIPPPSIAKSDYLVGAMYFGGWEIRDGRSPWDPIYSYTDRRPLLGYYDGALPAVTDWEIKWALESGIQCFVYCWYRMKENVGRKVGIDSLFLQNAIHKGLFQSKFVNQFRFAIMWENRQAGGVASEQDLLENLAPFWMENYFQHPSYQRLDGKPLLYIYGPEKLMEDLGGAENCRKALGKLRALLKQQGFPGLLIFCEDHGSDLSAMEKNRTGGFDVQFAYAVGPPWGGVGSSKEPRPNIRRPTPKQAMDWEYDYVSACHKEQVMPFVTTASMGWDPMPWQSKDGPDYLQPSKMTRWRLSPEEFEALLRRMKTIMKSQPAASLGSKMLLLDNWNEWAEGHFIAPHAGAGFGYLKAVRAALTHCDNQPDYRSPFELGLGPYELTRDSYQTDD